MRRFKQLTRINAMPHSTMAGDHFKYITYVIIVPFLQREVKRHSSSLFLSARKGCSITERITCDRYSEDMALFRRYLTKESRIVI